MRALTPFLIFFSVVLVFSPILANEWVSWDDADALVDNAALRAPGVLEWAFTTTHMSHFQPLSWLVWASAGALFGFHPAVFHALSLVSHGIIALLLYRLMLRLETGKLAAVSATLLYALHPLRVEPVAWASAFPYLLSTSFLLLATLLYLERSPGGAGLAYAASLLARPLALAYPFVLLLLDLFPLRRARSAKLVAEKIPFFGLALLGLFLEARSRTFSSLQAYGVGARVSLGSESLMTNIRRLLWPRDLTPLDPLPLDPAIDARFLLFGAVFLALSGAVVYRLRHRLPAAPILWLSWLLLLLPTLGFAPSGLQATADRYSYVPGLVVAIALGLALTRIPSSVSFGALAAAALLAGLSHRQSGWWRDSVTLWGRAVEIDSENDLALYFYAGALAKGGRLPEAAARYRELLRLQPDHAPARKDLALLEMRRADALASRGELAQALELYEQALELDPDLADASERRAMALFELGRFEEALPALEEVAREGPLRPEVASAYALLLASAARGEEAASLLESAVERFPGDLSLLHNLARLLATGDFPGREERAVELAAEVVERTGGSDPRALDTLAHALAAAGDASESMATFERAARLARSQGALELAEAIDSHARALSRQ